MATGDFQEMEKLQRRGRSARAAGRLGRRARLVENSPYWITPTRNEGGARIEEGRRSAVAAGVPQFDRKHSPVGRTLLTRRPGEGRGARIPRADRRNVLMVATRIAGQHVFLLGIIAVLGDTETRETSVGGPSDPEPVGRLLHRFTFAAVIALVRTQTRGRGRPRVGATALAREYAIPLGETYCLVGFAALAADNRDYEVASRHLATSRARELFRSAFRWTSSSTAGPCSRGRGTRPGYHPAMPRPGRGDLGQRRSRHGAGTVGAVLDSLIEG